MKISETPTSSNELDLLKRLDQYAKGTANWKSEGPLGQNEQKECARLYSALIILVDQLLGPLLNRVNAREMQCFTMHDSKHGLKVAHLMWNILDESRRLILTPPEIAILVISAHLHDLGMGMSDEERQERLKGDSDLWLKVDITGEYKTTISNLEKQLLQGDLRGETTALATNQITQAQEALLCLDIRERHAQIDRYHELIQNFRSMHLDSHTIPSIDAALSYSGDSFIDKLIDVCTSHNEDAAVLLESKRANRKELRFPRSYPIGTCEVDLRLLAATLRLADILDFDRERVPPVLFHYLLPRSGNPNENISIKEWQKHMSISNWEFSKEKVIFRGRSTNPIAHHAVLEFCKIIQEEIRRTRATFSDSEWPFNLAASIDTDIYTEGFTFLPYKFHLREEKIFSLLMGKNIYSNPLDAIRELIQNSVDACQLRDALIRAHQPSVSPNQERRIVVSYQEPSSIHGMPKLRIKDTGSGMDLWIIENYLLRVGESYYSSSEFLRTSSVLWQKGSGFSPVSEFGIGFISCFMLAEHIEIETAMPRSPRQDVARRILVIDGLGRLIHLTEFPNDGYSFFEGTTVTLSIKSNSHEENSISWNEVRDYIESTCIDLPYPLHLEHLNASGEEIDAMHIEQKKLSVRVADDIEAATLRIQLDDKDFGLKGEITLFEYDQMKSHQQQEVENKNFYIGRQKGQYSDIDDSILSRGGFSIGHIPGLPSYIGFITAAAGRLRVTESKSSQHRLPQTNLSRTELTNQRLLAQRIIQAWLTALLDDIDNIEKKHFGAFTLHSRGTENVIGNAHWLESYSGYQIYRLARVLWRASLGENGEKYLAMWENSSGPALSLGIFNDFVHRILFELILPLVCELHIGDQARPYVAPPKLGWIEILKNYKTVVTSPVRWGTFAKYVGPISDLLFFEYPGCTWIASQYEKHLTNFSESDLVKLRSAMSKLISARSREYVASLSESEGKLISKVTEILPDAEIGSIHGSWALKLFV